MIGAIKRFYRQDESGRVWILDGTLPPNLSWEVKREGMPIRLNNNGDTIRLINNSGATIDEFTYQQSVRGQEIVTGH